MREDLETLSRGCFRMSVGRGGDGGRVSVYQLSRSLMIASRESIEAIGRLSRSRSYESLVEVEKSIVSR